MKLSPPHGRLCASVAAAFAVNEPLPFAQYSDRNEIPALKIQVQQMRQAKKQAEFRYPGWNPELVISRVKPGSILDTRVLTDVDGKKRGCNVWARRILSQVSEPKRSLSRRLAYEEYPKPILFIASG